MSDTLDVISLDEGMTAVAMTGSGVNHEDTVASAITAISRRLDELVGPIVVRTITDEIHYADGSPFIIPNYSPVFSVTSITEYQSGTGTVLTAEDFDTSGTYLLRDNFIYRRSGWYGINFAGTVKLSYVAGRFSSTATVDARYKTAAAAILRRWWAREAPAWARGGDPFAQEGGGIGFFRIFDETVREFLADELRPPAIA